MREEPKLRCGYCGAASQTAVLAHETFCINHPRAELMREAAQDPTIAATAIMALYYRGTGKDKDDPMWIGDIMRILGNAMRAIAGREDEKVIAWELMRASAFITTWLKRRAEASGSPELCFKSLEALGALEELVTIMRNIKQGGP